LVTASTAKPALSPDDVERQTVVHRPLRARGIKRVELLLDAAERLLSTASEEEVSLASIAAEAKVPLPSVYHFFPNRNAILVALAGRYHRDLAELSSRPLDPTPEGWQDMVRMRQKIGVAYLNERPAALRLFMGAGVSVEVRTLDLRGNATLATRRAADMRELFECSGLGNLEYWIAISIGLMDGIWAVSYAEHGQITDDYVAESTRAAIAYLRCYLPEHLPRRAVPR
jgi:AcrR family transcriptional regulator